MIELRHVSYAYPGQNETLRDVSIRFCRGKISTILGPNGSGKSTLLKIACRLLRPSGGEVLLEGKNLQTYGQRELARKMAILSQSNRPAAMSVRDLVACGRYPHQRYMRRLDAEDHRMIDRALEQAGLVQQQEKLVSQLSGGQQQRAFIAMALAQNTDVIVLDEPTSSLDIHVRFEVMELIRRLNDEGKTIVMVLHDLELALRYSHDVILLDQGSVRFADTPEAVIESGYMDAVFGIRTDVLRRNGNTIYHFEQAGTKYKVSG